MAWSDLFICGERERLVVGDAVLNYKRPPYVWNTPEAKKKIRNTDL